MNDDYQKIALEELSDIRHLSEQIMHRTYEIDALRVSAPGVGSVRYDKIKVQTSPKNFMETVVADIDELERENEADKVQLDELKQKAYSVIRQIKDIEQRTVLEYYYLSFVPMTSIAQKMCMAERTCYDLRTAALESFGKILKSAVTCSVLHIDAEG